ncbi:MAG: carboxymuconolactone decarboxylase family protein [Terriglobales bacterium]
MQHHLASSKRAGLTPDDWKALKNPQAAAFTDKEKAALAFAEKLTRMPAEITDADVASLKPHFSDAEIVDLDFLIGLANLTNRFTDPLGIEVEFPPEKI